MEAILREVHRLEAHQQLFQQHIRLIAQLAVTCRNDDAVLAVLSRSLKASQRTTITDHAFRIGQAYVYVLELANDNWYVGTSEALTDRLCQHFSGEGAAWTKQHHPIRVVQILSGGKPLEKQKTLELMREKGFEHVRGHAWCQVCLAAPPKEL